MDFKSLFQNKWLVALGVLGIVLILFGTLWNHSGSSVSALGRSPTGQSTSANQASTIPPTTQSDSVLAVEQAYDGQLTTVIKELAGVHNATVMVTLNSTNQLVVANDTKRTSQTQQNTGQSSTQSTSQDNSIYTERQSDGSSVPFVTSQLSPTVRGVVVLVEADDFYVAKAEIIDAIGHVLDVPAYKISVEPKRSNP